MGGWVDERTATYTCVFQHAFPPRRDIHRTHLRIPTEIVQLFLGRRRVGGWVGWLGDRKMEENKAVGMSYTVVGR